MEIKKSYPGQTTSTAMVPKILGALPDHDQYWELFCGTCQIFKRKNPVESILVDLNNSVVHEAIGNYAGKCSYQYLQVDVFNVIQDLVDTGNYMDREISKNALIYMDPPWRISKLGNKKPLYKHSLTDNQTAKLLMLARELKVNVAILHYKDEMYDDILNDWNSLDFKVSFRGRVCDISLYMNYDYKTEKMAMTTFSGNDRTDRQRIKRKAKSWALMLSKLPEYERQVILDYIKKSFFSII